MTHGHTLTSEILFSDVIKIVKDYGFRQNPFPIILSIENHCHLEHKNKLAEILTEILSDSLYTLPPSWENIKSFPSPNELKYRVLIKDKADLKKNDIKEESKDDSLSDLPSDHEENEEIEEENIEKPSASESCGKSEKCEKNEKCEKSEKQEKCEKSEKPEKCEKSEKPEKCEKTETCEKHEKPEKVDKSLCEKLFKLITIFGIPLKLNKERLIWNISSLSEKQLASLMQKNERFVLDANRTSFTRIFPGGFRVNSSNYDPILGFMAGSQIIALNFQTNDLNLMVYLSKFMENGGIYCGYVLKPEFLRCEDFSYQKLSQKIEKCEKNEKNEKSEKNEKNEKNERIEVCIKVKSAQFLRPLKENVDDIIDPYIEVSIRGIEKDQKTLKTGTVMNNGLNPVFKGKNNKMSFIVNCPEIAMLVFSVFDENSLKNERVAGFAMPVKCLRNGYRIVPLRNCKDLEFFELSEIYCKVQVRKLG